jgi:HD superfamily phosphohydrolase
LAVGRNLQIVDPLFEPINIGEDPDLQQLYFDLLDTFELRRAQWVNQSGLLFQIYHGCTHTRRAHAIGCWCVGWYALDDVHVVTRHKIEPVPLGKWLQDLDQESGTKTYPKAFLASLLLHDVGHPPFSHAFELCADPNVKIRHEDISASLISGRSDEEGNNWLQYLWLTYLVDRVRRRYSRGLNLDDAIKLYEEEKGNLSTVNETLVKCKVEPLLVKHIILGPRDKETLSKWKERLKEIPVGANPKGYALETVVYLLHMLVDSHADFDRIDHLLRDSYYSGLRFADYRIRPFLHNLLLVPKGTRKFDQILSERSKYLEKEGKKEDDKDTPGYVVVRKAGLEYVQHLQAIREFMHGRALWIEQNLCLIGSLVHGLRLVKKWAPAIWKTLPFLPDLTLLNLFRQAEFFRPAIRGYNRVVMGEIPLSNYRCFKADRPRDQVKVGEYALEIYESVDKLNGKGSNLYEPRMIFFCNFKPEEREEATGDKDEERKKRKKRDMTWGKIIVDLDVCPGYRAIEDGVKGYERFTEWIREGHTSRSNNCYFWILPSKGETDDDLMRFIKDTIGLDIGLVKQE